MSFSLLLFPSRIRRDFLFMTMYYIAQVLPQSLNEKILPYKQMMFEKFGARVGLKSPAHITFVPPYYMNSDLESDLVVKLNALSSAIDPFPIRTNNFNAFKLKTIFIDVIVDEPLLILKKEADGFFETKPQYAMKLDRRPFHPHITIATRDFSKKTFFEVYPYFEKQIFEETWVANGLSLLRHNQKKWDVIHTSHFK
ncbi:MAG: hypothetical protein C4330_09225 [Chitinophagaceae bacterium]